MGSRAPLVRGRPAPARVAQAPSGAQVKVRTGSQAAVAVIIAAAWAMVVVASCYLWPRTLTGTAIGRRPQSGLIRKVTTSKFSPRA